MESSDNDKLESFSDENHYDSDAIFNELREIIESAKLTDVLACLGNIGFFEDVCELKYEHPKIVKGYIDDLKKIREINDWIESHMKERQSFQNMMHYYLHEKGYDGTPSDFYRKIDVDRRLFSKIYSEADKRQPERKTVFKLIIGFELSVEQAEEFLASAGYCFNNHRPFDMIIKYCLATGVYDKDTIDNYLLSFHQKPLFCIE